jgi:hypothetical protein
MIYICREKRQKKTLSVYYDKNGRIFVSFENVNFLEAILMYVLLPIFLFFIIFLPESMAFRVNVEKQLTFLQTVAQFSYIPPNPVSP